MRRLTLLPVALLLLSGPGCFFTGQVGRLDHPSYPPQEARVTDVRYLDGRAEVGVEVWATDRSVPPRAERVLLEGAAPGAEVNVDSGWESWGCGSFLPFYPDPPFPPYHVVQAGEASAGAPVLVERPGAVARAAYWTLTPLAVVADFATFPVQGLVVVVIDLVD